MYCTVVMRIQCRQNPPTLVFRTSKGVVRPLAQAPANAPANRNAGGADASFAGPSSLENDNTEGGADIY